MSGRGKGGKVEGKSKSRWKKSSFAGYLARPFRYNFFSAG